jgi:hypothetical protein
MRAFRNLGAAPLSPEPVEGWRAWSVVEGDGELRLSSLTRAESWEPAAPFVATCPRRHHGAPGRLCSCGVYAGAEPEELARLGRIAGAAVGQVSLWGRVAEHRRGYRAAIAYPSRLRLVCVPCLAQGMGEPATRVDRDPSAPARLFPLCERHAEGRTLPPAAPVQERLLQSYLVEMVPDGSIERIRRDPRVDRERRRVRRRRTAIALAAFAIVAVGALAQRPRPVAPARTAAVPSNTVQASGRQAQSGVQLPLERSGNGLISSPRLRVLLLTPDQFGEPRCGTITLSDVAPAECADPVADVFVEDVGPAGAHREGTCSDATVVITRKGDRILCWRSLPPN